MRFRQLPLLMLATTVAAFSQTYSITGSVTDTRSAPLPGVTVTLSGSVAARKFATTDENGKYTFPGLNSGSYLLAFDHAAFSPATRAGDLTADTDVSVSLPIKSEVISIDVVDVAGKATATRLEIPDSDIPVQVSSIPQQLLQQQGANDMVTALRNASGVQAQRWYGIYEYYTIRGFNSSDVVLVDGMRLEGNRFNTQLNNVESIEVLKGPASVLYGGSALGGAINIVRKKPQSTRAYDLLVKGGRFGTAQVAGGATGRLWGSKLLYRLDASHDRSDGWRGAGARRTNISPSLTYLLTERARVTVHQAFNVDNYDGDGGLPVSVTNIPGFDLGHRFSTPSDFGRIRDSQTHVLMNYNVTARWELRDGLLIRRTSDEYFVTEGVYHSPGDAEVTREGLYFHHKRRPILNQADIAGRLNFLKMRHTVLLGHEYQDFYTRTNVPGGGGLVEWPSVSLATLKDTAPRMTDFPVVRQTFQANRIHAMFWQDQIDVTRNLKINIGGRFDDYDRRSHRIFTADPNTRTRIQTRHQQAYTYRAGIVYSPLGGHQLYFNSSSSFTPVTVIPPDGSELKPQTGRSFEVGHRWKSLNGRIETSLAAYHLELNNLTYATSLSSVSAAGQQTSNGIDFDLNAKLSPTLRLIANYGYSQPKFTDYFDPDAEYDYTGLQPRFVQKHAANLWLNKTWESGLTASVGLRYLGPMFTNNENTIRLGGWTTFSGAVGYRRNKWEFNLNAENLLNRQRYFTGSDYSNQIYPGAPINVFATIRLRFN